MNNSQKNKDWSEYYEHQKEFWFNPEISIYVKAIIRIVELHRSDSKGWSVSVRKIASQLRVSTNTVLRYTKIALDKGFLESSLDKQRTRRKLRLSVSLRAPLEFKSAGEHLYHFKQQIVSPAPTKSVSTEVTVNSKEITNDNTEFTSYKEEVPDTQKYTLQYAKRIQELRESLDKKLRDKRGLSK